MKIYLIGGRKAPGFSLMEMLIVIALFSISVVIMAQTFASFNQLHRKIANRAVLSQELRFVTESLVRAARSRPISYATPPLSRDSELRLELTGGQLMLVKLSTVGQAECLDLPTVACLLLSLDSGATWIRLTGQRVHVEQFDVYVRPDVSPFIPMGGGYPNNIQPFVTMNIRLHYMADAPKEQVTLQTQTTVASRVYAR